MEFEKSKMFIDYLYKVERVFLIYFLLTKKGGNGRKSQSGELKPHKKLESSDSQQMELQTFPDYFQ